MALCLLGPPAQVFAQASDPDVEATEGVVVALEKDEVIVDVAAKRGAAAGDIVEIWRPLKLKHPVTGKIVTDRFRYGSLKLVQVRDRLSIARAEGKPSRSIEPGDIVVLRKARLAEPAKPAATPKPPEKKQPEKPPAPAPSAGERPASFFSPSSEPAPAADPDAQLVADMFDQLKGADITRRIIAYEDYVREHPEGRYAAVLWEEAAQLRRLLGHDAAKQTAAKPQLRSFSAPREALHGIPLSFGVELDGPARGAVLYARRAGEVAYQPSPMRVAGPGYFAVTLPATRMLAPSLEYFIEATTADGKSHALVASTEAPNTLDVEPIPSPTPPVRAEATASIWTDYAFYNDPAKNNDRVWQTEGFVGMRFRDEGLRALRTGFGVFRGVGGSLEELDDLKLSPRKVGLTYGYLEAEWGISHFTGLIARGVVGLKDDGITGGAQALVRIGNDKKTNLQVGGEVLGGVGLRGITQLEFNGIEKVPMLFRTEVTNQPAGVRGDPDTVQTDDPAGAAGTSLKVGEVGARAIVQVGYRVLPGLVVAGRGSYQGRNIKHAGPGFGGAVTYTW